MENNNKQDFNRDLAEIRSMMERSSKFLSLSGWAGIMAGLYALAGAYIAYYVFEFNPGQLTYFSDKELFQILALAGLVLIVALCTAVFFSYKKAQSKGEKIWNATSRRLLANMAVPLVAGGILILIFIAKGLISLIAPLTLLFYGLALYNAANFTIREVKYLGFTQIILGLISCYLNELGLLFWAIGFGFVHIVYGIYMYFRYEW